ncbi:ABC transporter permease [Frateuria aurantia]
MALLSIRRQKALSLLAITATAFGIGVSITMLTVSRLLSADPLPQMSSKIFHPQLDADPTRRPPHEPPDLLDYQSAVDLWNSARADRQTLIVDSEAKLSARDSSMPAIIVPMLSTTADFFAMFKPPVKFGHGWGKDDDIEHARIGVISKAMNDRLFGGTDSVGRTIRVNDHELRITGVLDHWRPTPQFYNIAGGAHANGETASFYGQPEDIITPFFTGLDIGKGRFEPYDCWRAPRVPGDLVSSGCTWLHLWVELGNPKRLAEYKRYLAGYATQQKVLGRLTYADHTRLRSLKEWLDYNRVVPQDVHLQTLLAFAFLGICLCNATGIMLTSFWSRLGEFALRRALGASRHAIFLQCLTQAVVLGIAGGILGLPISLFGLWLVRHQAVSYADLVHLDTPMFVASLIMATCCGLSSGLIPALRACTAQPAMQMKIS